MLLLVSFYTTDTVWGFPKWTSVITAREKNLYDRVWVRIFFPPFNSAAHPAEAVEAFSTLRYGWLHLVAMEQPEDCNYNTDWGSVMPGQLTQKPGCMSQSACGLWDVDGQSGRLTSGCPGGWDCLRGLTHGHPSSTVSPMAVLHVWSQSSTVIPLYTGIPLAISRNSWPSPSPHTPRMVKSSDHPTIKRHRCGCPIGFHRYHSDGQSWYEVVFWKQIVCSNSI